LTIYDVRFLRHFAKAGAKVQQNFDMTKFLSNFFQKKCLNTPYSLQNVLIRSVFAKKVPLYPPNSALLACTDVD